MADEALKQGVKELKSDMKEVKGSLSDINATLIRQEASLNHHIYRTDLAEENAKELKRYIDAVCAEIKPLKKKDDILNACLRIFGGLALVVSVTGGIIKIIEYFGS